MAKDSNAGMKIPIRSSVVQSDYDWVDLNKIKNIRTAGEWIYFATKNDSKELGFSYAKDLSKLPYDLDRFKKIFKNEGEVNMFKQVGSDLKAFIAEHKSVIYWLAVLFLADHFFFQGAFRERLNGIMNKMLGKVESQLDAKTVTLVTEKKA